MINLTHQNFIFIDGSYFTFFRYHALILSYKHNDNLDELNTPEGCDAFKKRFNDLFIKKFKEIPKKLKIKNAFLIVALDCPRSQIWRKRLYPDYKSNRHSNLPYVQTELFKMVRDEKLFNKAGAHTILLHPHLEADDCIAIVSKQIRSLNTNATCSIITSDMDYLQLADNHTKLYDLKYKDLTDNKNSFKDKHKDLFCKIVMGDKSDNIPAIFSKCGIKTAEKFYGDPASFNKKLADNPESQTLLQLNKTLIDFNMIPQHLVDELLTNLFTEPTQ